MKTVVYNLANEGSTLVDAEDVERMSAYRWYSIKSARSKTYVVATTGKSILYLHRFLLDAPKRLEVDHINNDGLDNRKANLRLVTRSQNEQAKPSRTDTITGVRNVSFCKWNSQRPYRVMLMLNQKAIHIGYFASLEQASEAAKKARQTYFTHAPEAQ